MIKSCAETHLPQKLLFTRKTHAIKPQSRTNTCQHQPNMTEARDRTEVMKNVREQEDRHIAKRTLETKKLTLLLTLRSIPLRIAHIARRALVCPFNTACNAPQAHETVPSHHWTPPCARHCTDRAS